LIILFFIFYIINDIFFAHLDYVLTFYNSVFFHKIITSSLTTL